MRLLRSNRTRPSRSILCALALTPRRPVLQPWLVPATQAHNALLLFPLRHWHYQAQCHPNNVTHTRWGPRWPSGTCDPATKEAPLALSRDRGGRFAYVDDPIRESLIGIGASGSFGSRVSGVVPTPHQLGDRLFVFLKGTNRDENGQLDPASPNHTYKSGFGVVSTRAAGLASLQGAGRSRAGNATTVPLLVPAGNANTLTLNLDTRGFGFVRVAMLDASSLEPLPGFSLGESVPMCGINSVTATATWSPAGNTTADGRSEPQLVRDLAPHAVR